MGLGLDHGEGKFVKPRDVGEVVVGILDKQMDEAVQAETICVAARASARARASVSSTAGGDTSARASF